MERITLGVLTLAAAVVSSRLIASGPSAIEVRQIESLSVEERVAMKNLSEIAVYNTKEDRS